MKRNKGAWVFIFPVLHLVFIGLMLSWHVRGTDFFGHISDRLSLRGTLQVSRGAEGISQLDVQYEGLNFPFFQRSSVQVIDPAQDTRRLRVTGYNTLEDGFSVLFNEGFSVQFLTQGDQELRIIPTIPETMQPVAEIVLPVRLTEEARIRQTDNIAVLSVDHGSDTFLLTLPPRAVLNAERGTLTLPGNVGRQTIRYVRTERVAAAPETTPAESEPDVLPWFESEEIRVAESAVNNDIRSFIDTAYEGWRSTRFDAGTSTWQRPDASPVFREETLIAYLAESWQRNDYTGAFNAMRTAADRHPDAVSYRSSVYLGNLRAQRENMESQDQQRNESLQSALASGDSRPLRDPDLVSWILTRGTTELYEMFPEYLADIRLDSLETAGLVGVLENSLYDGPMPSAISQALRGHQQPAAAMLLERLVRSDGDIYLESSNGQVESLLSLRAGIALERVGSREDEPQLTGIGRTMIQSILREADSLGFVPATMLAGSDGIQRREGQLAPEDIYPHIHRSGAYPRVISLYDHLGQGAYIMSIVDFPSISYDGSRLELNLVGPRMRTHYIYISGLPAYRALTLFGFQWPADPGFESYSRGTFYHQPSNTAMIKYFEDATSSEIIYQF
ncbi:hypothetical protein [Spirochaeta africana]|uniref:Uncharacterized protein n=1 Tax=Spirochaeta africana (strain ATCC 700263 / DSM 8902 / Z-7692) TaxID=889378 RepID=H9UMN5_SPIAZ|nr:hypothetical protein [Spirochaeta africana]AFG38778.1 hypothetical protein Spiaf_2754 [Spirochaeta africana DSM 8902]